MCAPISITTGGAVSGCTGICRVLPQIIASAGLAGVAIWNFRYSISKRLSFRKTGG